MYKYVQKMWEFSNRTFSHFKKIDGTFSMCAIAQPWVIWCALGQTTRINYLRCLRQCSSNTFFILNFENVFEFEYFS